MMPAVSRQDLEEAVVTGAAGSGTMRYVARQPILDSKGRVHGYELLFRAGPTVAFSGDGNHATRDVLDQTSTDGLDRLTGGLPVFINCTLEALREQLVTVLPPKQTILEVLETLEPTAELLELCLDYKAAGFRIALDDFSWTPAWEAFLGLADYIKVDISTTTAEERASLITRLRSTRFLNQAKLVAERVETPEDLTMVQAEGFTLFQGYYFCKPVLLQNRRIPENHMIHMQMLQELHREALNVMRVSDLVKRDAALTYKLLRLVNSPLYGLRKTVTSIRGALVLVGDEMFRRIATLAIASELRGSNPSELLRMAFLRGRFCELAAAMTGADATEQYLLGILSLFPAMLRVPMEKIADSLPLRVEVRDALLGHINAERTILEWLMCFESAQWENCDAISMAAGLRPEQLPAAYKQAVIWAEENMNFAV